MFYMRAQKREIGRNDNLEKEEARAPIKVDKRLSRKQVKEGETLCAWVSLWLWFPLVFFFRCMSTSDQKLKLVSTITH